MNAELFPGKNVHIVGIKGTGCAALAELLVKRGYVVTGSDGDAVFYTDAVLRALNIPFNERFDAGNLPANINFMVRSAAYGDDNPEVAEALRRGIPVYDYPTALGMVSQSFYSCAVAGVHGKTTTTGLCGALVKGMGMDGSLLVGSALSIFDGGSTYSGGDRFFIAETCEYRRHFLKFSPRKILLTAVEPDHQDYFKDEADIESAFVEFARKLPPAGELIYCADQAGAVKVAAIMEKERPDLVLTGYGESANGPYRIEYIRQERERVAFKAASIDRSFALRIPGRHNALNAVAALALITSLCKEEGKKPDYDLAATALDDFRGSRRRSEILGERRGVLVMDDYGHHPTAIATTLKGIKAFYPDRRLVVSFMSHTYSRTAALLNEFVASLDAADVLILHKIYASAREVYHGGVTGVTLFEERRKRRDNVYYFDSPVDAAPFCLSFLKEGDLFLTLGAGDNFVLGQKVYKGLA